MSEPDRLVLVERRGDVALLTLNRPNKRNALSLNLRERLADALEACAGEDTGAIVPTGAGSAFCAGMDVTQFGGDQANRIRIVETSTRLFTALATSPTPTLAFLRAGHRGWLRAGAAVRSAHRRRRGADGVSRARPLHPAELCRRPGCAAIGPRP